ncbi:hypothetical protein COO60DRAFT_465234 [Scenedesmus sp. NREL 46B-D3]|nr:hypothetical protein COO60DRAFT_465234 [Scenedesmus sp. NREL 46B-D3]
MDHASLNERSNQALTCRVNADAPLARDQYGTIGNQGIGMQTTGVLPSRPLRLVLGHNCLSTGCGDSGCALCEHNQSRRCRHELKAKYVSKDLLRANCGAGLLVGLVDGGGQRCSQPLPGWTLQVCVV